MTKKINRKIEDINELFENTKEAMVKRVYLRKYLNLWQRKHGLYAILREEGGLEKNAGITLNNIERYKLPVGKCYLCYDGMLKYELDDVFEYGMLYLMRVIDNQERFVLFEKVSLINPYIADKDGVEFDEFGLPTNLPTMVMPSPPYKECFLKHDMIVRPKYVIDDRGAMYNAIEPTILRMPDLVQLEQEFLIKANEH